MSSEPSPFSPNVYSTRIEPEMRKPKTSPVIVSTGMSALRSACFPITRRSVNPRLRAVSTNSWSQRRGERGPRRAGDERRQRHRERDRGQGQVVEAVEAGLAEAEDREPAESHREDRDQEDAGDVGRDRRADERDPRHRRVERAPAPESARDPEESPKTAIKNRAYTASSTVGRIRGTTTFATESRKTIDSPRSPLRAFLSQVQYWTRNGSSRR